MSKSKNCSEKAKETLHMHCTAIYLADADVSRREGVEDKSAKGLLGGHVVAELGRVLEGKEVHVRERVLFPQLLQEVRTEHFLFNVPISFCIDLQLGIGT